MEAAVASRFVAVAFVVLAVSVVTGADSKSFNISNNCQYTVWPGISGSAAAVDTTGLELAPGQWEIVPVPSMWSGRVWGRTLCSSGSRFTCVTGDCGSGKHGCAGGKASPPVTLAEFTFDGSGGKDFYDVSLVDGFNLPMVVAPKSSSATAGDNCAPTGCVADLNAACPAELRVTSAAATGAGGGVVGCKSACEAFGSLQYCCTGESGKPNTCKPSAYSELFKKACPLAVTYAYDDGTDSIFSCGGGGGGDTTYAIAFCPGTSSGKSSSSPDSSQPPAVTTGNLPHIDGGGSQVGGLSGPWRIVIAVAVIGLVTAALTAIVAVLGLFKLCFSRAAGEH